MESRVFSFCRSIKEVIMKALHTPHVLLAILCSLLTGCLTTGGQVPIGGVVDWYRPDASFPVPEGYMVADGSTVTDPQSPLVNKVLPDLRAKFVQGATTPDEIGTAGGMSSHSHGVNAAALRTSDVAEPPHQHTWAMFDRTTKKWKSSSGSSEVVMVDWGDGLDSEGSGIWPLGFDEEYMPSGSGWFYLTTGNQSGITVHHHNVDVSGNVTIGNAPNDPPHVKLMKIVRIK